MRNYINIALLVCLMSGLFVSSISASVPLSVQFRMLVARYDYNRDKQLGFNEVPIGFWNVIGRYDFNRDGKLSEKEFIERRIGPGIKK